MIVGNNSTSLSSVAGSQGVTGTQAIGMQDSDGDGDGGGRVRGHHHHGGGQLREAMAEALQSLGLSSPSTASAGSAASNAGSTQGAAGGPAVDSLRQDMRHFMHELFEAAKGATAAGASGNTSSGDPKSGFAAALSSLISEAGNGSAPSGLSDAFSTLMADLKKATPSASGDGTNPQATLQAFLSQLQKNLGYDGTASAASGNVISTAA